MDGRIEEVTDGEVKGFPKIVRLYLISQKKGMNTMKKQNTTKDLLQLEVQTTALWLNKVYGIHSLNDQIDNRSEAFFEIVWAIEKLPDDHALFHKWECASKNRVWADQEIQFLSNWRNSSGSTPAEYSAAFLVDLEKRIDEFLATH